MPRVKQEIKEKMEPQDQSASSKIIMTQQKLATKALKASAGIPAEMLAVAESKIATFYTVKD